MASLWIGNQGELLSADQARAMFETPSRLRHECTDTDLDQNNGDEQPRMGMGLAVVTALAHAHGGYAWVASSIADGTRFGMDIPLTPPPAPPSKVPGEAGEQDLGTLTIGQAMSREK